MRTTLRRTALIAAAGLAATTLTAASHAGTPFADADAASVHPGVMLLTNGAQCTANFVFTGDSPLDSDGVADDVFIGYAAHCAATGGQTDTNGCLVEPLPLGTPVEVAGSDVVGQLAYSSWGAMRDAGQDPASNACAFNDFALVEIAAEDVSEVNPSVPAIGGPVALRSEGFSGGEQVYNYGNSSLRQGIENLSPRTGVVLSTSGGGWTHSVYTVTPGIPGDSGSGFMDADGNAFGVTSTLALAPLPGSNGISDLALGIDYANDTEFGGTLALVPGDVPFAGLGGVVGGLLGVEGGGGLLGGFGL